MMIVSQDKDEIINFDNVESIDIVADLDGTGEVPYKINYETCTKRGELGKYKTEERAKEVLQAIVGIYQSEKMFECTGQEEQEIIAGQYKEKGITPFKLEMPKE